MDRESAKAALIEIGNDYPDLLEMLEIRKNKTAKKTIYSFQINELMLERAKKLARSEKISVSNVIRQAIKIGLPQLEQQQ